MDWVCPVHSTVTENQGFEKCLMLLEVWCYDIKSSHPQIVEYVNRNKSCNNHCTIREKKKKKKQRE